MADIAQDVIFISRAGADSAAAIRIAAILRTAGYETILQDEDFRHTSFMAKMQDALTSGARVVCLLSKDYLESEYCSAEWGAALAPDPQNRKQRVILFRVGDCKPAGLLGPIRWTDLSDVLDDPMALADKVRSAVGMRAAVGGARGARTLIDNDAIWEVPSFTGRQEALTALRTALFKTGEAAVTQPAAVHGMGGVGKSALAKEYARRNRAAYSIQWWFNAEKEDGIVDGLIRLGTHFLPDIDKEQDRTKAARTVLGHVFAALDRPALLVFDNIEQPALIAKWKPHENAHVLVTSRVHGWGGGVTPVEIEEWPPDEARDYLLKESGRTDITPEDAAKIAEKLGYLPLALAHAAAYLRDNPAVTAQSFIARSDRLMDRVPEGVEYPRAVYATFQQALSAAEKRGPGAAAILCLASFFAPNDIPFELFEVELDTYPADSSPIFEGGIVAVALRSALKNEVSLQDGLSALAALSLIDLKPATRCFSAHRLVLAACRDLVASSRAIWVDSAIAAGDAAFPHVEFNSWPLCDRLVPHVEALAPLRGDAADITLSRLLSQTGYYLFDRAEFSRAERLFLRALAISEEKLAPGDPRVAACLNNLASTLRVMNRLSESESLHRRALAIDEKSLGSDNPEVAIDLCNLALLLNEMKRPEEAEPLYLRALAINEKSFGSDHPVVATAFNNYALLLRATNRLAEAESLQRRALAIDEKSLGPDHPDVATELTNLAVLLSDMNRLEEAEPLYRRALAISEKSLGFDHPAVAHRLHTLSFFLSKSGRLTEAVPMAERAAAICAASFGEGHPNTTVAKDQAAYLRSRLDET